MKDLSGGRRGRGSIIIYIHFRHLKNDSDPIVMALDPFQLLPASEDIHVKGLIK